MRGRKRKWGGETQGERDAARKRAARAEPRPEIQPGRPEIPPVMRPGCFQCIRLKRALQAAEEALRNQLARHPVREATPTDPEGARYRMAARLCNALLVKYVPREEWELWERLNPWLLDPEVARRQEPEEHATAEEADETRAA